MAEIYGEDGSAPLPSAIDLLLTDACNLRCSYCPIWGDGATHPIAPGMIDTNAAITFVKSISSFVRSIRLFGGEPFLHPGWFQIARAIGDAGMHCTAVTNGTTLERDAEKIIDAPLLAVGVSLDPASIAGDEVRGRGITERVRRGIAALASARRHRSAPGPQIVIYATVHEQSFDTLEPFFEELRTWPIDRVRIQHLIFTLPQHYNVSRDLIEVAIGDSSFFKNEEKSYIRSSLPHIAGASVASSIDRIQESASGIPIELRPPLHGDELTGFYERADFRRITERACRLIDEYCFVDPRGRVYPCMSLEMGNVFVQPLEQIWNGERYRNFRKLIHREQRLPLCERCPA